MQELEAFAKEIKGKTISFNDMLKHRYRHSQDNMPIYVTGGFTYYLVFNKLSIVKKESLSLYYNPKTEVGYKRSIEKLFKMPYSTFNNRIIKELKSFTK